MQDVFGCVGAVVGGSGLAVFERYAGDFVADRVFAVPWRRNVSLA